MENILFIQSEKFGKQDYLFLGETLIRDFEKAKNIFSKGSVLVRKFDIPLIKSNNPFFETIKRIPTGFLIKGQLNQKDDGGRTMNFTCFYIGNQQELKTYLNSCLGQIGKSYNEASIKQIEKSITTYNMAIKIIIAALTATAVGYSLLKLI